MRWRLGCILAFIAAPVHAEYLITFFAHDYPLDFPHAFVVIKGTADGGGAPVDAAYGFTAKAVTPGVFFGSVPGEVETPTRGYIARSQKQFALPISDAQFATVMSIVARWRTRPGSNYNLNKHNCVSFVAEIGQSLGLNAKLDPSLAKHPKAYLESVIKANSSLRP